MKIEYLADGFPDCPLIRLYNFAPSEAAQLRAAFASLADGADAHLELTDLPFIVPVADCALNLRVNDRDRGIVRVGPSAFELVLTNEAWREITEKVDPFTEPLVGECYQWLNEDSGISLLLSPTGTW